MLFRAVRPRVSQHGSTISSFSTPSNSAFFFYRICCVSCLLVQPVARRKRKSNKASRLSRLCAAAAEFKPLTTLRRSSRHPAQHILVGVRVHTKPHIAQSGIRLPTRVSIRAKESGQWIIASRNPHKRRLPPSIPRKYNSGSPRHLCVDHSIACCTWPIDFWLLTEFCIEKV